jgi:hypothetical protein
MGSVLVALLLAAEGAAGLERTVPDPPSRAAPGLEAIHPSSLAARFRFLSSEALEGRGTGSRGLGIAENYLAAEMQAAGLEAAGEAGSFLQAVPLRAWRVDQDAASLELSSPGRPGVKLLRGQDFVALSDGEHSEVEIDAPLVIVGYAVSAPEFGYDDLHGADLRGKIAVVLDGAPLSDRPNYFPPAAHAVYADRTDKLRRLADRGAVGALFVYTPEGEEAQAWVSLVRSVREEGMGWLEGTKLGSGVVGVSARGVLSMHGFEKLLAAAAVPGGARAVLEKAQAGRLFPQALNLRARLHSSADMRELRSHNVAGMLRGSDPARGGEVLVVTTHLDHSGIGEPVDDDSFPEGATDNAPGVAVLLELAKAFAALPIAPRRSILFLSVTGAEQGLLGSQFFARHPTVPRDRIVAALNVDGTPTVFPFLDAVAIGAEDSTLGAPAGQGAATAGIALSPDPEPREGRLARSDHFSFARAGIPSLMVTPGRVGADAATRRKWYREHPPAPGDKRDAGWDWEAVARFARLQFWIALLIADDAERPSWVAGDFFQRTSR